MTLILFVLDASQRSRYKLEIDIMRHGRSPLDHVGQQPTAALTGKFRFLHDSDKVGSRFFWHDPPFDSRLAGILARIKQAPDRSGHWCVS